MVLTSPPRTQVLAGQLMGPLVLVMLTMAACDPAAIQDLLNKQGGGGSSPPGRVDGGAMPAKDGTARVNCVKITQDSVLVAVEGEGEPRVLHLR